MKPSIRPPLFLLPVVLLAGCATTGSVTPPAGRETASRPRVSPPSASASRTPEIRPYRPPVQMAQSRPQPARAVHVLMERAADQQRAGDLVAAANTLERALRIDPRNPVVWNRLARVRLAQGRYRQAAGLAAKSSALAGNDAELKADNQRIIARANAR